MDTRVIIVTEKDFSERIEMAVFNSLKKFEKEKALKDNEKLYSINAIAKRLGKAHATIKRYCAQGLIQTTKSGLIPESAIEKYLQGT